MSAGRFLLFICVLSPSCFGQSDTFAQALLKLADETAIQADTSEVVENTLLTRGAGTRCKLDSRPARCAVDGDTIRVDSFVPAFRKKAQDFLEIDRAAWSRNDQFMIVQVHVDRVSWIPASAINNGDAFITQVRDLAKSGKISNCWENTCSQVVSASSDGKAIFAECSVRKIDDVTAFPRKCTAVMFQNGQKIWIKAISRFKFDGINPAAPITESITITAGASLGVTEETLVRAAEVALTKEPFFFEKRSVRGGYNSLLAIANPRPSKVLAGGWFEWPTVSIEPSGLTLYIDCDLLVNKYNTTRPDDWHQPERAQQESYCGALVSSISRALESVCGNFGTVIKDGTNQIECQGSAEKVGPRARPR
jgi:hypothetical protein